jgi:hypothetical protein
VPAKEWRNKASHRVRKHTFAAAKFWKWAAKIYPADLPLAKKMLEQLGA